MVLGGALMMTAPNAAAQVVTSGYHLNSAGYGVTSGFGTSGYALSGGGRIVGFQPAQVQVRGLQTAGVAVSGLQLNGLQTGGLQVVNLPTAGFSGLHANRGINFSTATVGTTIAPAGITNYSGVTGAHAIQTTAPAGVPGRLVKYYYRVPVYGVRTKATATTTVAPSCNVCTPSQ